MEDDRRYDLGLGDDALCAIGRVSAQWAVLEYYLARTTIALAQVFGTSNAADNISFAARRTVFQNVLQCKCVPSEVRTTGVGLVNRMQAVENRRHRIVHGMANEFAGSPEDQPPRNSVFQSRPRETLVY